ncbi:ABC transporter ATP-binding protein [Marinilabilia rubra]|uniref:ABC transporter ATP-binding protein n=2 Tax=Marinilabilia rubra TaxID=2162893 RepID=A0A2U2B7T1_9BACT|nr:ABC transporter ATP-binding protein [Marinilabilia rubra]
MLSKLKFLLRYTHRYKWWYTGGFLFLGLTIWTSVTIPEYIQKSIDIISQGETGNREDFYNYVLIILGMALVLILIRTLSRVLIFVPGRLIEKQLKGEMFRKLSFFGKDYYDSNSTGSIISRINNDINGVRMITGFGLLQTGNILFSLSLTPYKMWNLSPALTLYCIAPMIIIFILVRIGMVIMVKNTHRRMDTLQQLSGKTISFLSGNGVIKSYNIHKWAEQEVEKENTSLFNYTLKITWVRSFIIPLLANLEQVLKIVVLFVGGMYVIEGKFTIGQLTEYIAYSALLTHPIMGLGWVLTVFQQGFVGISSIQTIMGRKGQDEDKKHLPVSNQRQLFDKGIHLRDLTYTYHNGEHPELKNISFSIKPGQVVGITGKVGSGKTTLINLLNGYLRPEKGQLYMGDKDVTDLTASDIRSVVKTVTQEVFLFSDTIKNNVIFGSEQAESTNDFTDVIYKSAFADELTRFPKQAETLVGEKGIMLSGGQKQRISLARALYAPCKLLILDDVFSAVDTDTERFLIKQIFENHPSESLVIVSNRTSVLEKTDFTVVLENGEIETIGNHKELLKRSDFYRETWELQK